MMGKQTVMSMLGLFLIGATLHITQGLFVCPSPCTCEDDPEEAKKPGRPSLVVDCRKQSLTSLPPFDGLHGVIIFRLFLDRNDITSLPEGAFDSLTVHGITLSDNPLVNISAEAFTGAEGIQYLSLRRTKLLTQPRAFAEGGLQALQVLDVGEIKTEIFSGELAADTLGSFPLLEQLFLQQNKLTSISDEAFEGLPSLFELYLEANQLTGVDEGIRKVDTLDSLHLDGNPIASIPPKAFHTLGLLDTLTLSDTRLQSSTDIDPDVLSSLSLRTLDLSTNTLGTAPCELLKNLEGLEELKLRDAMLNSIAPDCFAGLSSIKLLDISGNSINVSDELLGGIVGTIEVLLLERLELTMDNLPLESLRKMSSLKELSLSGNTFPVLPNHAFHGLTMRKLSLSYCEVESIAPTAFEGLKAPFTLDLNNNKVRNLTFLDNKCQFERIELYRNPVSCDCAFYHVVRYGITTFVGQCVTPEIYSGIQLNDFKSNQNVTSECGTMSGVKDTILCFWQYRQASPDDEVGGASAVSLSFLAVSLSLVLSYME